MRSFRQAFADIPIVRKLQAGFGAVLVVIVLNAAVAIYEIVEIGEVFDSFSDIAADARLVTNIEGDLVNLQLQAREYLASREGDDAEHFVAAYAALAADLTEAQKHIHKPERVALLNEIIELKERYGLGFARVRGLNDRRNMLVDNTLNPIGQRIREALTAINETAYRDRDYQSANYAGVVQEDLLTARLYVNRFLGTNNLADVRRVHEEFNEVNLALVPLDRSLESPERRRLLAAIQADLPVYRLGLDDLVAVISERNNIRTEVFDKIGAEILVAARKIEASAAADKKTLGKKVAEDIRLDIVEVGAAALLGFAVAFVVAGFVGRGIGEPIRAMTGAMGRLSTGDLSVVIPGVERKDEIGSMAEAVRVFREHMIEVEALRASEHDALRAAAKASQAKSEFLARMSHELRTPMNAVLGFAQILETDRGLNADQRESIKIILKAGEHLLTLINEVLDLSRIEAGYLDVSIEDVSLTEQFDECETLMSDVAKKKGVALVFPSAQNLPFVRADHTRLKQVLVNLLGNAVKYNRPRGSVRVTVAPFGNDQVRIAVADTGLGIPEWHLEDIFEPFERLGAELTEIEGTGIGLSYTKRVVEAMRGTIGVESKTGEGSTFWIRLPAAATATATATATASVSGVRPATILYVEDNPLNMKLVRQILGVFPEVKMIEAGTAQSGLDLAKAHQPDLILLDINLPGMNGIEMVTWLRAEPEIRLTPIVAISAAAMPDDIARAMAAGFDDYVTKPINVPAFLEKVSRCLERQAAEAKTTRRA